MSITDIK